MSRLLRTLTSLWLAIALAGVPLPSFSQLSNVGEAHHCMSMQQDANDTVAGSIADTAPHTCQHCKDRGCSDKNCSGSGCQPCHSISFIHPVAVTDLPIDLAVPAFTPVERRSSHSSPPLLRPPVRIHS
ncbi:MAG TPA: hypothetical protein ENK05_06820 [Gammaproteobacteria bacterium]|nr:hypothetical protein [Gammaproteobacteria bacterium]